MPTSYLVSLCLKLLIFSGISEYSPSIFFSLYFVIWLYGNPLYFWLYSYLLKLFELFLLSSHIYLSHWKRTNYINYFLFSIHSCTGLTYKNFPSFPVSSKKEFLAMSASIYGSMTWQPSTDFSTHSGGVIPSLTVIRSPNSNTPPSPHITDYPKYEHFSHSRFLCDTLQTNGL